MSGTDLGGATVPELLLRQSGWARRLARRLVEDTADADDLVQEAMLAGVRRPPASGQRVRGWLATVMRNLARNRGLAVDRRRARERAVSAEAGATSSPEEALALMEVHRLLARLVGELPDQERQMVVMRYFEERTSEEIGLALSLPAGTVRWRLGQAIEALRRRLDDEHGGKRRWSLVLGALIAGKPQRAASLGPMLAAGAVGIAATAAMIATSGPREIASPAPVAAGAPQAPREPPRLAALANAAPAADDACPRRLAAARGELDQMEQDLRRFEDHAIHFEAAAPSPAAQALMAPLVADLTSPEHAGVLECRAWVCRVMFLHGPEETVSQVRAGLAAGLWNTTTRDQVLRTGVERVGGISRDPLSGQLQQKYALYLHLRRDPGHVDVRADPPACRQDLERVRASIESVRPRHARALPVAERWKRAPQVDRAATTLAWDLARQALGRDARAITIECRAGICRVDLAPPPTLSWRDLEGRLRASGAWNQRFPAWWVGTAGERYARLRPATAPAETDADRSWRELRQRVFALIRACVERHPGNDGLHGTVLVPATGELNEDGAADRPSARVRGPGASSPFGACVRGGLAQELARIRLPEGTTRKEMEFSFTNRR